MPPLVSAVTSAVSSKSDTEVVCLALLGRLAPLRCLPVVCVRSKCPALSEKLANLLRNRVCIAVRVYFVQTACSLLVRDRSRVDKGASATPRRVQVYYISKRMLFFSGSLGNVHSEKDEGTSLISDILVFYKRAYRRLRR